MAWLSTWRMTMDEPDQVDFPLHIHDRCEVLFLLEGEARIKIDSKIASISAGDMVIISRMETHGVMPVRFPYTRIGLHIQPDYLLQAGVPAQLTSVLIDRPEGWDHVFDLRGNDVIRSVLERIHEENTAARPFGQEMAQTLVFQFLLHLFRAFPGRFLPRPHDSLMEKVRRQFEEDPADQTPIREIAARYFFTPAHFSFRFRRCTGYSPQKYRGLCRIMLARRLLLAERELPLEEVAEKCGYTDLNSFVRAFRTVASVPPGKFRKLAEKWEDDPLA